MCKRLVTTSFVMLWALAASALFVALAAEPAMAYDCTPCSAADSSGTVHYPSPCPHKPTTGQFASIIDGLPQGTTIDIPIEIVALQLSSVTPGGPLGGEVATFEGQVRMPMTGTGTLAGFVRDITMVGVGEVHSAPRTPGNPVQSFDTDMFRLQGQSIGDPDFDLLRITAGSGSGLPSPGHVTILKSAGTDWSIVASLTLHTASILSVIPEVRWVECPAPRPVRLGFIRVAQAGCRAKKPRCTIRNRRTRRVGMCMLPTRTFWPMTGSAPSPAR